MNGRGKGKEKPIIEFGLSGIKGLGNRYRKSENLVLKIKSYEETIEETMAIIEKVGSEGNINNNVNTKTKSNKVRNNKSIAFT